MCIVQKYVLLFHIEAYKESVHGSDKLWVQIIINMFKMIIFSIVDILEL
jgi:hypothetical protein